MSFAAVYLCLLLFLLNLLQFFIGGTLPSLSVCGELVTTITTVSRQGQLTILLSSYDR